MMKKKHSKRQPIYIDFFAVPFFSHKHPRQVVVWFLTMFFLHANKHPIIIKGNILYFCNITFQNELSHDGFHRFELPFSQTEKIKTKFITIQKKFVQIIFFIRNNWKEIENMISDVSKYLQRSWSIGLVFPFFSSSFATIWYWFSAIVCNCWYQKKIRTNEKRTETINSECQTPIMIKCTMRNNLPRIDCVYHIQNDNLPLTCTRTSQKHHALTTLCLQHTQTRSNWKEKYSLVFVLPYFSLSCFSQP